MAELTVPRMDFSSLGELPKVYRDARTAATRERTLADLGKSGGELDYNTAARALLAAGDTQTAMTLAQLGNNQRDFQFRQSESTRAQGNTDRDFVLRQQTASPPQIKTIKDANGNDTLIRVDRHGNATPINTGVDQTPTNPYAMGGKATEGQSKDALFASRMFSAEKILRDPEIVGAATSLQQKGLSKIPLLGNFAVSGAFQNYDQAKRNFVNAVLRKESGAVISDAEFENAEKQYFPQPGDTKERIAQKLANRADAIRGVAGGAGPSYRPESVFGAGGEIVANPAAQRNVRPSAVPSSVPPQAIEALRGNPSLRQQFEQKYGPGSAAQVLGQ